MAAINRVQYHPPPPLSFCEGPRILQKLRDVVVQIVELPLYILSSLFITRGPGKQVGSTSGEAESFARNLLLLLLLHPVLEF